MCFYRLYGDNRYQITVKRRDVMLEHSNRCDFRFSLVFDKMERATKTHKRQYELFVQYLERYPQMLQSGTGDPDELLRLWHQLRDELNAMGVGGQRSVVEWKRVFQNWKYTVRYAARQIQSHSAGSGCGGPAMRKKLSPLEERMLSAYGRQVPHGCSVKNHRIVEPSTHPQPSTPLTIDTLLPANVRRFPPVRADRLANAYERMAEQLQTVANGVGQLIANNDAARREDRRMIEQLLEQNQQLVRGILNMSRLCENNAGQWRCNTVCDKAANKN